MIVPEASDIDQVVYRRRVESLRKLPGNADGMIGHRPRERAALVGVSPIVIEELMTERRYRLPFALPDRFR
jgi:hypothetical protein